MNKPFDLSAAKEGKPVITRGGNQARIICFDRNTVLNDDLRIIIGLVKNEFGHETVVFYDDCGMADPLKGDTHFDLFMAPVKRYGWINILMFKNVLPCNNLDHHHVQGPFDTFEDAGKAAETVIRENHLISTFMIEWEEK
jgi:hypothetical protein